MRFELNWWNNWLSLSMVKSCAPGDWVWNATLEEQEALNPENKGGSRHANLCCLGDTRLTILQNAMGYSWPFRERCKFKGGNNIFKWIHFYSYLEIRLFFLNHSATLISHISSKWRWIHMWREHKFKAVLRELEVNCIGLGYIWWLSPSGALGMLESIWAHVRRTLTISVHKWIHSATYTCTHKSTHLTHITPIYHPHHPCTHHLTHTIGNVSCLHSWYMQRSSFACCACGWCACGWCACWAWSLCYVWIKQINFQCGCMSINHLLPVSVYFHLSSIPHLPLSVSSSTSFTLLLSPHPSITTTTNLEL